MAYFLDPALNAQTLAENSPTAPMASPSAKSNRYGAKCARSGCGKWVKANEGLLVKNGPKWEVVHTTPCP